MTTCAALGHPGATYNPLLHRTWCACGLVITDGDTAGHITCCSGPLDTRPRRDTRRGVADGILDALGGRDD